MSRHVIAIDGPAGSGKSSVAKTLAECLGWSFLDTGAMYRAVTTEVIRSGLDPENESAVADIARRAIIRTVPNVSINGRDVQDEIRSDEVNIAVSKVSANVEVRAQMVKRQRDFAREQPLGTVVEGRDIATVVFPEATLKVFLTASLEERAKRRGDESEASLHRRDIADSTRNVSPLRQAEDALVLDTTGRNVDEVVEEITTWLNRKISS